MYYIQVCNNTQDFSQQNMFVFIIFFLDCSTWDPLQSFQIISLISRPDDMAY